jgi:hypothetical protein
MADYFHFFLEFYSLSCSSFEIHNFDVLQHFCLSIDFCFNFIFGSSGHNLSVMSCLGSIHTLWFIGNGSSASTLPPGSKHFDSC